MDSTTVLLRFLLNALVAAATLVVIGHLGR
jgi:hypothetical protein